MENDLAGGIIHDFRGLKLIKLLAKFQKTFLKMIKCLR